MNLTNLAHAFILDRSKAIYTSVDATCGNGYDSAFLATHTKDNLYCFDIQKIAINETRNKLNTLNLSCQVHYIEKGHQHMSELIPKQSVDVVMFNLGYLPGSDHQITTNKETSLHAIQSAYRCLKTEGSMTILSYTGHPGGEQEHEAIKNWYQSLQGLAQIQHFSGKTMNSPHLYCIIKRSHA